jgi:hypothetical protein
MSSSRLPFHTRVIFDKPTRFDAAMSGRRVGGVGGRNSFRGTVGLRTGEIVTNVLCEQVGEGVGEFGGVGGSRRGRCL